MKKQFIIIFILFITAPLLAGTAKSDRERMMRDLDVIGQTFEVKYAPAEWKKSYTNWDLNEALESIKGEIQTAEHISVKDYQRLLLRFMNQTKDYHVAIFFYSTEVAALPFRVKKASGKYFIEWADSSLSKQGIHIGDEVLSFNKIPIDEAVEAVKKQELGNWDSATDDALAAATLTLRIGSKGHLVPNGSALIAIRSQLDNKITHHPISWQYVPEWIPEKLEFSPFKALKQGLRSGKERKICEEASFHKDMTTPLYAQMSEGWARLRKHKQWETEADGMQQFIGHKASLLPPLGKIVRDLSDSRFEAYIFELEGKYFGFLRIPTYDAGNFEVMSLVKIINELEGHTEALVIDQLNNPGGSVFYMYSLASMLSDQPLKVPSQRMTLTQEDLMLAVNYIDALQSIQSDEEAQKALGRNIGGFPVDCDVAMSIVRYFYFILREWRNGRCFTDPGYLYGLDYLKPHPLANYTHPILILVNELDFSCGDFFPAIMQDNQRAKIMGSQTAGAGGYVLQHQFPNLFGVEFYSYTGSIALRDNQDPIENLGVTPDIPYSVTEKDLQENYSDYAARIQSELLNLIR